MTTISLDVQQPHRKWPDKRPLRVALVGNPNSGKTTLFNRLTGLRAKTSNFPGTTLERRAAKIKAGEHEIELIDLPGLYSAHFADQSEELLAADALHGRLKGIERPDAVVVIVDATCLSRHLYLASEVREMGTPMVVALNMIDEARKQSITICLETLGKELDATIVPISGRTGEGIDALRDAIADDLAGDEAIHAKRAEAMTERIACTSCSSCPHTNRHTWACGVGEAAGEQVSEVVERRTEKVDSVLTHPFIGLAFFGVIMYALFFLIFRAATYPMDMVDAAFGSLADAAAGVLPDNLVGSFLVDGVIAGLGGVVIFLPQILILFFVLTLLEDTGYLARAAFVMDRIMQKVGLPGKAFIPMLSAHACAIPAIMSTKVIESRRDRLITILVIPLMTCSARLPVYAIVASLAGMILYPGEANSWERAILGGGLFFGAYTLGILAAMLASFILGKTILKGKPQELVIELPPYRWPSLRVAFLTIWDRGIVFLKQAGTVILLLSIIIWAAMTFPQLPEDKLADVAKPESVMLLADYEAQIETAKASGDTDAVEAAQAEIDNMLARYSTEYAVGGRIGKAVEPVFAPLGFDWRIDIGVVASFAAREVVVSTLAITAGIGEEGADDDVLLRDTLAAMKRPDGSPLFDLPTLLSLLVFFVLAMQCLPTQAVTKRETGSWKWAVLQFGYMTVMAYAAAMITYQVASAVV
ncbi:MAG: ferrous iron transporter B [Phycisphaeraceae bacterium]|nr:ferrous iron transporter B [Phycisphaeraceae bacterium]